MRETAEFASACACFRESRIDLILLPDDRESPGNCVFVQFLDPKRLAYCLNRSFDLPQTLVSSLKKCAPVVLEVPHRAILEILPKLFDAIADVAGQCCAAMAEAAPQPGMSEEERLIFARQVMSGSALMSQHNPNLHFAALKDSVTAPGGMTIKGLHQLRANGFQGAIMDRICQSTSFT